MNPTRSGNRLPAICLLILMIQGWPWIPGAAAQDYPSGYFRPPMDIPLKVSGTFAEFRYDHLHSGIDFPAPMRTPVFAIADGYVSRIRQQAGGFGKALYLSHPNGYTSVYAHLDAFNPTLEAFLTTEQYRENTFELDFYPEPGQLPVKKGELVAHSGNSGISQGPHLHFEIRQTSDEGPVNPLLFGFKVGDERKPVIRSISIYPATPWGKVIRDTPPVTIPMQKKGKTYLPKLQGTVSVPPYVIFGIHAVDLENAGYKNGLYTMDIWMDDVSVYHTGMDYFTFDNFRAVNNLIDYPLYQRTKKFVQLSRVSPCNTLSIFRNSHNRGVFDFSDGKPHVIRIRLGDIHDNLLETVFTARCHNPSAKAVKPVATGNMVARFPCDQGNEYVTGKFRFYVPLGALYDTLDLEYQFLPSGGTGTFSGKHRLHNGMTPLNDYCLVSVKPEGLPVEYEDKACLARVGEKGSLSYVGGRFENGWVTALTRKFGTFAVAIDKTPPTITPLIKKNKKGVPIIRDRLTFKLSDNFSGIHQYCGYVNGTWVMMSYDFKKHTVTYKFDQALRPGKNTFELTVSDKLGNLSTHTREIVR